MMFRGVAIGIVCGALLLAGGWAGDGMMTWLGFERAPSIAAGPFSPAKETANGPGAANIPAPPGSKLLAAERGAGGAAMYRYSSGVAIPAVVAYYRTEMPKRAWREVGGDFSQGYAGEVLAFGQGSKRRCYIAVSRSEVEKATVVTIIVN
jgi:hypothetical protein